LAQTNISIPPDAPLLESGLIGPVRLIPALTIEVQVQ
jgi:hypothetical protein